MSMGFEVTDDDLAVALRRISPKLAATDDDVAYWAERVDTNLASDMALADDVDLDDDEDALVQQTEVALSNLVEQIRSNPSFVDWFNAKTQPAELDREIPAATTAAPRTPRL